MAKIEIEEDLLYGLALVFMEQFEELEPLSLDEFLIEYRNVLTSEQLHLGYCILRMFE